MSPPSAYRPAHPLSAAKPTRNLFDPWNSSSTGHQRAENRLSGSTSWRDSRTAKLGEQFKHGHSGGRRLADTVGAGSEGWKLDGRLENGAWVRGASGLRSSGQRDISDFGCEHQHMKENSQAKGETTRKFASSNLQGQNHCSKSQIHVLASDYKLPSKSAGETLPPSAENSNGSEKQHHQESCLQPPQIFKGLTIYLNGSTYPLISDHKFKRLLASHGACISIALGRRSVTHVILGKPNESNPASGKRGAGGGLASSKINKEIAKVDGKGIKYVGPEWVLESIRLQKKQPESRFSNLKVAHKGQRSVLDVIRKEHSEAKEESDAGRPQGVDSGG